jgi:ATP-dependent Clp protease adapter protein ClpS
MSDDNGAQNGNIEEKNLQSLEEREREMEEKIKEMRAQYEEQKSRIRVLKDSLALRDIVINIFKEFEEFNIDEQKSELKSVEEEEKNN